jgi:hypothetical protein
MGLHGPLALLDVSRGNPGRRSSPGPKVPPEVVEDAKGIYKRLKALGDYYGTEAEAQMAQKSKRPSPALWAALKCWKEALYVAYRIAGVAVDPTERDTLALHLAKRPKVPRPSA